MVTAGLRARAPDAMDVRSREGERLARAADPVDHAAA
jgi:hypothetical protein